MAMSKLERLRVLADLAKDELDKAQDVFVAVRGQRDGHQAQLDSLLEYHADYVGQLTKSRDTSVTQLQTMQAFLDEVVEKAHAEWLEKRVRHKSLEKLCQKIEKDHHARLEKQEQKLLDELASQRFVRGIQDS